MITASIARFVLAFGLTAVLALAADVTGTWKMSFQTPDGQTRESTLKLKAEGEKLTGTLSSRMGDSEIKDGKVAGDNVSFSVVRNFNGQEFTSKYDGKVSGNEIKFNVSFGERSFEMTAKKAE
jgi:hypothetical protein